MTGVAAAGFGWRGDGSARTTGVMLPFALSPAGVPGILGVVAPDISIEPCEMMRVSTIRSTGIRSISMPGRHRLVNGSRGGGHALEIRLSSLPTIPSPSRGWMFRFELLHGHRTSVPILFSQLGFLRAVRAVLGVARRQMLGPDPLAALGPDDPSDVEDWLARRQLRPLPWLDSALTEDLGVSNEERLSVLGALVGATGAAFLGQLFPTIDAASWKAASNEARETLVRRTMSRFGNIAEGRCGLPTRAYGLMCASAGFIGW